MGGLIQIEAEVEAAFRAHSKRLWSAIHPPTARQIDEGEERVAALQAELAQVYEELRAERTRQAGIQEPIASSRF